MHTSDSLRDGSSRFPLRRRRWFRPAGILLAALASLGALVAPRVVVADPVVEQLPWQFTAPETMRVGRSYSFVFRLFDSPDPLVATPLWEETKRLKVASKQKVAHLLGSVTPFSNVGTALPPVDFGRQLWVEVRSGAKLIGGRRVPLAPVVPYALSSSSSPAGAAGGVAAVLPGAGLSGGGSAGNVTLSIAEGGVDTTMLAAGAITDDKVLGPIAGSKISGTVANADTLDGTHASGFAATTHVHAGESITAGTVAFGRLPTGTLANQVAVGSHTHGTAYYTKAEVDALVAGLQSQITALATLLQHFSRSGNDISITGANLWIKSGSGTTDGTVNGLGNLIVGYNDARALGGDVRTGSHNLVVGMEQNFSGYGGLVAGRGNTISGFLTVVSGGVNNTASGYVTSVSGGANNTASGNFNSVSGGTGNTASGNGASVSGGAYNSANSANASVSGGYSNTASGEQASIGGGSSNTASGNSASVSGGAINTASGSSASVSGGYRNTASGYSSTVVGGGGPTAPEGNNAFGDYAAILGGAGNIAGDPALGSHTIGQRSTVSGGANNRAVGSYSSVAGGGDSANATLGNVAVGDFTTVLGGVSNTAGDKAASPDHTIGKYSAILGGNANNTKGWRSTVAGGDGNVTDGAQASVAGGYQNSASGWGASVGGGRLNAASGDTSSVSGGASQAQGTGNGWTGGAYHTP